MTEIQPKFWAKTLTDGQPGITVHEHCLNVGCVARALIAALPPAVSTLLPSGADALAALHDIGKITLGFQAKCAAWLLSAGFDEPTLREAPFSVSDHALVSQVFLQKLLESPSARLWAAAVGAHHGRPKGNPARLNRPESQRNAFEAARQSAAGKLLELFGPLPAKAPDKRFGPAHSDLWLLAGLVTVADWIGSNEDFFSASSGVSLAESQRLAANALASIGWPGGKLRQTAFTEVFAFAANSVQKAVAEMAAKPGLIIVEAPMGCGKTEAALHAAQQLIAAGYHHGIYFALPTQVTSNRIHHRVGDFLDKTLDAAAHLQLAHANAWLERDNSFRLNPSFTHWKQEDGEDPVEQVHEARSWFASSKQALLAPYGVGTIDQALQGIVTAKHFFVRRFALAGKVVILDEIHSYDVYTGTLVTALVRELINLGCSVIILSATLTARRRQELLIAGRCPEADSPTSYPLVTVGAPESSAHHLRPAWNQSKHLTLRAEPITEEETLEALISRAEAGQHVLWIRNTVIEAQQSFRALRGALREGSVNLGLLHSRFPFQRRAKLEDHWLEHLGRNRPSSGPGSIIIATQVVEQSVDIDLDFIVSDLAPTDMLLQRMGRLWRHERPVRAAAQPEFWIRLPEIDAAANAYDLKKSLGRSAKVYAPYVLLRSAAIFHGKTTLTLPADIRPLLEATYADSAPDELAAWRELHEELEKEKHLLTLNAEAAMLVLGRPMLTVDEQDDKALTRRKGPPTVPVLILRRVEQGSLANTWQLTAPDGTHETVSEHEWRMASARFLHRWLVRVPRWMIPCDAPHSRWLELHVSRDAVCACAEDDGRLSFAGMPSATSYHEDFGIFVEHPIKTRPEPEPWSEDDDEFDN